MHNEESVDEPDFDPPEAIDSRPTIIPKFVLNDRTIAYDCIELSSGQGNWSAAHPGVGLRVHPGIERETEGIRFGDLLDNNTLHRLARLAYSGAIREWHAGPPRWTYGTLRRPRLRSETHPAGFNIADPLTKEQTLLAVRMLAGCFISCGQPGSSVMFALHAFQVLLQLGCQITKFAFCSFGSGFNKPSKWLHNTPWLLPLSGTCSCPFRGKHVTVQGSFTKDAIAVFDSRCRPDVMTVYGKTPKPGKAVSAFSAAYPLPLCRRMAADSIAALQAGLDARPLRPIRGSDGFACEEGEGASKFRRPWFQDPDWVEDICESLEFSELFRFRFKKNGHINCLECRPFKSWLKHCAKKHPGSRLVALLQSCDDGCSSKRKKQFQFQSFE